MFRIAYKLGFRKIQHRRSYADFPSSHDFSLNCVKDLLDEFRYADFDRGRWIRSSINYYSEKVEVKQGKELIEKTFAVRDKILEDHFKD